MSVDDFVQDKMHYRCKSCEQAASFGPQGHREAICRCHKEDYLVGIKNASC